MNKLAVLAFTLLIFFSTMLWYLANGSLNDYLKSQIELQGRYYSEQETTLAFADFSANTGIATFKQLYVNNVNNAQAQHALIIDEAQVELSAQQHQPLLTQVSKITINKLSLNIEPVADHHTNIEQLIQQIRLTLANDYPELYPSISAKIYAAKNPTLNAENYAKNHPQAGPIIEHTKPKQTRGKPQAKILISTIYIKTLELNTIQGNTTHSIQKQDVAITDIGSNEGLAINQLGGEILLHLLNLANP